MITTPPSLTRVLIIDDSPEDRAEVRRLLLHGTARRFSFMESPTGAEGLQAMRDREWGPADFVVLDYDLPDTTAPELLAQLADADGLTPCPVVVLTGTDDTGLGRDSLRAGAQDYINKSGIRAAAFVRMLDNAAERWAMAQELRQQARQLAQLADRDAFLLKLADATRPLRSTAAVVDTATALLGRHLQASRVCWGEVQPDGHAVLAPGYADGVNELPQRCRLSDYGEHLVSELTRGRTVTVDSVADHPAYSAAERAAHARLDIAALLCVPLISAGETTGLMGVHQNRPRAWTAGERVLVEETASRTSAAISRVRSDVRVLDSERRMRLALQAGGMGVWHWNVQTNESHVDDAWRAMTGLAELPAGQTWAEYLFAHIHPADAVRVRTDAANCQRTGGQYRHEFRLMRPDGRMMWLAGHAMAVRNTAGEVSHLVGVNFDITDRKRAEQALSESRQELKAIADTTPDILARFDRQFRHLFVNAAVEAATGRKAAEFIGKTNRELGMPAARCEQWEDAFRTVFDNGTPLTTEFTFNGPEETRHYLARIFPERSPEGSVDTVLCITTDITERVRAERTLRELDRHKDEFLATLAHELRNPLTPLRTGVDVLRLSHLPSTVDRIIEMMERQLGHLTQLVEELLDVSRIGQGKVNLRLQPVPLASAIGSAVESCQSAIDGRHQVLSLKAPQDALMVNGDGTRLMQVFCNLLDNASKYSPIGASIWIDLEREGHEAVVRVRDNGSGISAEDLPTIWDLFTQLHVFKDAKQGGLGIGLSLARKLVELHGGTVTAASPGRGEGSTFTVRLPLAEVGPTTQQQEQAG